LDWKLQRSQMTKKCQLSQLLPNDSKHLVSYIEAIPNLTDDLHVAVPIPAYDSRFMPIMLWLGYMM
jgi:hypothetical protein